MNRRPVFRSVAVALLLGTLLFSGAQFARSAVRRVAAPLDGLERLAQRPPAPEPAPPALPSSEDLGWLSPSLEELAPDPHNPAKAAAGSEAGRFLYQSAKRQHAYKEAFQVLETEVISGESIALALRTALIRPYELTLDRMPQLAKDLALSDLQRERIDAWLKWKKEALAGSSPEGAREIEEATAEAVRAELDYFQGELFDKRHQEGAIQVAYVRFTAADALHQVKVSNRAVSAEPQWVGEFLKKAVK